MNALSVLGSILTSSPSFNAFPFSTTGASSFALVSANSDDPDLSLASGGGFNISGAAALCATTPTHSWEYGAAAIALLELYTPWASVYGMKSGWNCNIEVDTVRLIDHSFLFPRLNEDQTPAATWALDWIHLNEAGGVDSLSDGEGSTGDPASLGVIAHMIGKTTGYEVSILRYSLKPIRS